MNKVQIMKAVFEKLCKEDNIYVDTTSEQIIDHREIEEDTSFYIYVEPDIYFTKSGEIVISNVINGQIELLELVDNRINLTTYQYY